MEGKVVEEISNRAGDGEPAIGLGGFHGGRHREGEKSVLRGLRCLG